MDRKIVVFEIGQDKLLLPEYDTENIEWLFYDELDVEADFSTLTNNRGILVLIRRPLSVEEISIVGKVVAPYRVLYTDKELLSHNNTRTFIIQKGARLIKEEALLNSINELPNYYFDESYGEARALNFIKISRNYKGKYKFVGNHYVELNGEYGKDDFIPVVEWRINNIFFYNVPLDIWPEYTKDDSVEVKYVVRLHSEFGMDVIRTWKFCEHDMKKLDYLQDDRNGFFTFTCYAKGQGTLKIGKIHSRYSRTGAGVVEPGGRRKVSSDRTEILYYFNPMNAKPPLNVYFAGYRTRETFEANFMMQKLGRPYLLMLDTRVEGGGFYIGDDEYENMVASVLTETLDKLEFTSDQLILSGISMGSFGALYYSSKVKPKAVIMGKPLIRLGRISENDKDLRAGNWPVANDLSHLWGFGNTPSELNLMDEKIIEVIKNTDLTGVDVAVSYMKEDDYDKGSYDILLDVLRNKNVKIYGRGYTGRHNDNTYAVAEWFRGQFERIIQEEFDK